VLRRKDAVAQYPPICPTSHVRIRPNCANSNFIPAVCSILVFSTIGYAGCGRGSNFNANSQTTISFRSEAFARGARMLRTALGPAIAAYLEDPSIVEVMLNPDGRLWIDRLSGGLEDTGSRVTPADAERIVRLVAHRLPSSELG
jgi:hypothetical protein